MNTQLEMTRALTRHVLENANYREWTVQGFGFLRTYVGPRGQPKEYRLNLWDKDFTVPNVSTIHDHPWDFSSMIVAGQFANQRYQVTDIRSGPRPTFGPTHEFSTITTGIQSNLVKSPAQYAKLMPHEREDYKIGDTYWQMADEVHETKFLDGSITINKRRGDTEHARVFWPFGTEWVDAKPRAATEREVTEAVTRSLNWWF